MTGAELGRSLAERSRPKKPLVRSAPFRSWPAPTDRPSRAGRDRIRAGGHPSAIVRPPGEILGRDAAGPVGARSGGPGRGIAGSGRRVARGYRKNEKRHQFSRKNEKRQPILHGRSYPVGRDITGDDESVVHYRPAMAPGGMVLGARPAYHGLIGSAKVEEL